MNPDMPLDQALAALDPTNDDHWTADGLPRMDALHVLTGDESLKRGQVTAADPRLTRETAVERALVFPDAEEVSEPEGAAGDAEGEPVVDEVDVPTLPGLAAGSSVLNMQRVDVLRSPDLTEAALGEIEQKIIEAHQRRSDVDEELKQLHAKNEILKRAAVVHERNKPKGERRTAINEYLAAQSAARKVRADRARLFIEAGTTARDVADALRSGSRLDAAMGQRKPARGSQRPPARTPA